MLDELCLFACENHLEEARQVLERKRLGPVRLCSFPARCGAPSHGWDELRELVLSAGVPLDRVVILAGGCAAGAPPDLEPCCLVREPHCSAWFAREDVLAPSLRSGGYLLTSGWLLRWRQMLAAWGFDRDGVRSFFRDSAQHLVLLDTGIVDPEQTTQQLGELSTHVGLPTVTIPVGLDAFDAFLTEKVYAWRLERAKRNAASAHRIVSEYAATADLVVQLASAGTEEDIVALVFDTMEMLFAPGRLAYLPVFDGSPGTLRFRGNGAQEHSAIAGRMACLEGEHAWTPDGEGFTLRVRDRQGTLAILEADRFAVSGHRASYLEMAKSIVHAFGLAVANARAMQALRVAEARSSGLVRHLALVNVELQKEISERVRTESQLRESESRFRLLSELAPVAIYHTDRDGRCVYVNERWRDIAGLTTEQALGDGWRQAIHPEDLGALSDAWDRLVRDGGELEEEFRFRAPDGRTTRVLGVATSMRDERGGVTGILGVNADVTRLRRVEEEVKRFSNVLARSLNEIYMFDAETLRFVEVNRGALQNLGYTIEELREMTPVDLKPIDATVFGELLQPLLERTVERIQFTTSHRRKDGTEYPVRLHLELSEGDSPMFIVVALDLTEEQAAERDRAELGEQLRQSQKMEAVGRLAGGVAHDFNNMLTVILGTCEFLKEDFPPGSQHHEDIRQINESAERAKSLTRQLLAFSRRQTLRPETLDLNQLVQNMHKMLARMIGEHIELVSLPGRRLWPVEADAGQLSQVVLNLVLNARDAMPDGGKLTVETCNVELDEEYAKGRIDVKAGQYVLLAVSDTGEGMDAETRDRIFEPFFTTKSMGEGTGLGLSTVHGIITQSGGTIWVYSEIHIGTTFKVYLPRATDASSAYPSRAPLSDKDCRGSETILIVEDEDAVLQLAARLLTQLGYHVLRAENGLFAEEVARDYDGEIHLLLTDVVMPGRSGRATAEALVALRPSMRVVYMSGYTDNAIVHHGVLDPGTVLVEKPFSADLLARTVRDVLDGA